MTKDLPIQDIDKDLIGQIDTVEEGVVKGWACARGRKAANLQVSSSACVALKGSVMYLSCSVQIPGSDAAHHQV